MSGAEVRLARRVERPRWVNARTIAGAALLGLSLVAGDRLISQGAVTTSVWALSRDLPAGATLGPDHLVPVEVNLSPGIRDRYLPTTRPLDGASLTRPALAGELIAASWITDGPAAMSGRSLTIPVSPQHAVGGSLRSGDRLDVYATFDAGDIRARTTLLVREVIVLDVVTTGGLVMGEESVVGVTVAVAPEDAARIVLAIRAGEIDLVRVESGRGPRPGTTVESSEL